MTSDKATNLLQTNNANNSNNELENKLWAAADQLRANSSLSAQEYSHPVLGLIFLKYADHRFSIAEQEFSKSSKKGRRKIGKLDYQARGVMFLPEEARYKTLLNHHRSTLLLLCQCILQHLLLKQLHNHKQGIH